jgi:hypothetical protein
MSPTRRALLGSVPLVALAGCLGVETRDEGSGSPRRRVSGTDTDPTVLKARNPDGEAVLLDGADVGDEGADDPAPIGRELVTTEDRAAELSVAEGVSDADRSRIRSFLEETDYDAETVYASRAGVRSCYRLRIESVSWEPRRVEYEYCRELRPPDAACEAGERVALALLFRLPAALDPELTGSGSSGRSPCRGVDTEYEVLDANATVPGNATAVDEGGDGS